MMPLDAAIVPTQSDVLNALRSYMLATVLPAGVDAILGVENRVPQPQAPNFVVMTPIRMKRFSTDLDLFADVKFTAAIAPQSASFTGSIAPAAGSTTANPTGVLTVSAVASGTIQPGAAIGGTGVTSSAIVIAQLDGSPGGIGRYSVNKVQSVLSEAMTAGWGLMTVSFVFHGVILVGAAMFGVGVAVPTYITAQLSGSAGGAGTYAVTPSQTRSSQTMASGAKTLQQNAEMTVQLDFHSTDLSAGDLALAVSTAFRDELATEFFKALPAPQNRVTPLYADDPRYVPYQNENQQWERRWALDACLQVNQVIAVPQQFADAVVIGLIEIDSHFPP